MERQRPNPYFPPPLHTTIDAREIKFQLVRLCVAPFGRVGRGPIRAGRSVR